jgi:hypothetical protein
VSCTKPPVCVCMYVCVCVCVCVCAYVSVWGYGYLLYIFAPYQKLIQNVTVVGRRASSSITHSSVRIIILHTSVVRRFMLRKLIPNKPDENINCIEND